eukprot:g2875.t1
MNVILFPATTPRVWSLQEGVQDTVHFFSQTLMRPVAYSFIEDLDLAAEGTAVVSAKRYELDAQGLAAARLAFNCEEVFKAMSESGVLNRGSDCDELNGMFDLSSAYNQIPYVWSLPHFYLVEAPDSTQHPRNNLIGFVTPTGPRYRNMAVIEPHSGRDDRNYFFTKHKSVAIPLYWRMNTKNATQAERQLLSEMQSTFRGLEAGFIAFWLHRFGMCIDACMILGGVSLLAALFVGMLLYRDNSLQTVQEKRKRIQAELAAAIPPDTREDRDEDEADERADLMDCNANACDRHHLKVQVMCSPPFAGPSTNATCPRDNVEQRNATLQLPTCVLQCTAPEPLPKGYAAAPEGGWRCAEGFIGKKKSVIVTDLIAQSFIKIFNNAFLNTIEQVRQPHLINVLKNLKTFAARELKADGKTFMAVAASFVKHLADPYPLKTQNIQAALLGLDANPLIWTRYGLDLLGISLNSISIGEATGSDERLSEFDLGHLMGTIWISTILLRIWNLDLTVKQYLEIEKVAGVAAFFGASTACAAFVNKVSDDIATQLAEFGSDLGLVVSLLKDVRRWAGVHLLDFEEALRRVKEHGMMPTIHLVNKLGARATARLECLEESKEKEALLTLVRGVACLHLMEDGEVSNEDSVVADMVVNPDPESRVFDMKVANLRLRAQLQRIHSSEQRSKHRLDAIQSLARGDDDVVALADDETRAPQGLGLEFNSEEVEWLILRGLERRTPLPEQLDLTHLLSCVSKGQDQVQERLLGLQEAAQSTKLKKAINERQTMHQIFGPDVAVLSGDFLFAHASGLIESLEDDEVTRLAPRRVQHTKNNTSLAMEPRDGALSDVLYTYGFYLGLAFQIADDVLDFTGGEELGKPVGQDLSEGNLTAPVILCVNGNEEPGTGNLRTERTERKRWDRDLGMAPTSGSKELRRLIQRQFAGPRDLDRALEIIRECGGVERANKLAEKMADKALEALSLVAPKDSEARRALAGLCKWAVRRSS